MSLTDDLMLLKQAFSAREGFDDSGLQSICQNLQHIGYREVGPEYRDLLDIVRKCSFEELKDAVSTKIIVSLTTYPKRIKTVHKTIETILNQTMSADRIILWLAEDEFPHLRDDLPDTLNGLIRDHKLEIEWCKNLMPHKKYFYAMRKYRNEIIITIDDDLYFEEDMIETLFYSYLKHPYAVSALRTHMMTTDENGFILPYVEWVHENTALFDTPLMELFATNGAGSLFPPHIFDTSLFDEELVMRICPYADDIWLKVLGIIQDIATVQPTCFRPLKYVENTQEEGLWKDVNSKGQNDIQLAQIKEWVDQQYGQDYLENRLMEGKHAHNTSGVIAICSSEFTARKTIKQLNRKVDQLQKTSVKQKEELHSIKNSISFKIGRLLTFLPRKIKSLLKQS